MNENLTKEYKWIENKTCAHNYLFPRIFAILKENQFNKESQILDAGCGSGIYIGRIFKKWV